MCIQAKVVLWLQAIIAEAEEEARGTGEEGERRERTEIGERGERFAESADKTSRRRSQRIDDDMEEEGPRSLQRRRVFLEDDEDADEEDIQEPSPAPHVADVQVRSL
jgi:hypothetical protein